MPESSSSVLRSVDELQIGVTSADLASGLLDPHGDVVPMYSGIDASPEVEPPPVLIRGDL